MSNVRCELIWLRYILKELQGKHLEAVTLHGDYHPALHIVKNPVFHEKTKHIERDFRLVQQHLTSGLISTTYTPTSSNLADLFTKPLGKATFATLLGKT